MPGSSPLARGLQSGPQSAYHEGRIIPARAGFTSIFTTSGSTAMDHPRSRGVYEVTERDPLPRAGSSPLARGLPYRALYLRLPRGIIPARAGFT